MLDDLRRSVRRPPCRRLPKCEASGALEPNDYPAAAVHCVDGIDEQVDKELFEVVADARHQQGLRRHLERNVDRRKQAL